MHRLPSGAMAREEFENMKVKSLVTLGVTLLLIVLLATGAIQAH